MMPNSSFLSLVHVYQSYFCNKTHRIGILNDICLDIQQEDFLVLLGPSGSGKSTLLRLIAGLEPVESGQILLNHQDITQCAPNCRPIGLVFQNYVLYPHLSVYGNLAYPIKMRKIPKIDIHTKIQNIAHLLDIESLLDRKPAALSGGQQQRVAIARAMIKEPLVYLLDEPLSHLDITLKTKLQKELKTLQKALKLPMIYVTHDQSEGLALATRLAILHHGHIEQIGPPQEVYHRPVSIFVAQFVGQPTINFLELTPSIEQNWQQKPEFQTLRNRYPQGVLLGIRPEAWSTEPNAQSLAWSVIPTAIEDKGSYCIWTTQSESEEIVITTAPEWTDKINLQQTYTFYVPKTKILVYHKKTELLLGTLSDFC